MGRRRLGTAERNTDGERGEGSRGQGLVSQPLFCPFDGCWMGKDTATGQMLCAGVLGEAGVRGGTKGAGGGQGLPPQPHTLGIWTRRASCGAGALRLLEHIGVPVMEAQQNQGLPPALVGERTQHLL